MDRAEAAVHYITHATEALEVILERCARTQGAGAADQVSRAFTDLLFVQKLPTYCEVGEVYSLWGVESRREVHQRTHMAEFIVALYQQFSMMVEPPHVSNAPGDRRDGLTAFGQHLVFTIGVDRPSIGDNVGGGVHVETANYSEFFKDIPTRQQVSSILSTFPWMGVLYVLSLSTPESLGTVLTKHVVKTPVVEVAGQ